MGFFTSILDALLGNSAGAAGGGIAGAVSGLTDTGSALIAFFTTVTDYRMWRSLGWLLLGIVLIGAGLALAAKDTVVGSVAGAVKG